MIAPMLDAQMILKEESKIIINLGFLIQNLSNHLNLSMIQHFWTNTKLSILKKISNQDPVELFVKRHLV